MNVFIVRPFGIKKVLKENPGMDPTPVEINFEKVQQELIDPALSQVKLEGGTTGKIFEPGDIREDMFSLLLRADIVITDITIHNANVFYELGIRHALRDRKTILIKSPGISDTPFDILGYKYLSYDRTNPGSAVNELIQTINDTVDTNRVDSPVFKMLPKLKSQDYEEFLAVSAGFADEVIIARKAIQPGKLSLLAYEAETFEWKVPGLRLIGDALFQLRKFDLARLVWEKITAVLPYDIRANDRLATIYQRLAEREMPLNEKIGAELLARSDIAIDNLLKDPLTLSKDSRSEVFALKARNAKTRWLQAWRSVETEQRGPIALKSDSLQDASDLYLQGYYNNLNHFYAGINALSLVTLQRALSDNFPREWEFRFAKKRDAERASEDLAERSEQLKNAVWLTIKAEQELAKQKGEGTQWLDITEADFVFLTDKEVGRVVSAYTRALEGGNAFAHEAVNRQLSIFFDLDIKREIVEAVRNALHFANQKQSIPCHTLLFTGHMIDKPGRAEPRFPPEKEAAARDKIHKTIKQEAATHEKTCVGISGGACGGDILFHEACAELGIASELYLALPAQEFIKTSVEFAGPQWVDRFNALYQKLTHHTLCDTPALPKWLSKKNNYTIWERNNLWELNNALLNGGMHMTLIALWDGKGGDGPGGTEHMVNEAKAKGAKVVVIDTKQL